MKGDGDEMGIAVDAAGDVYTSACAVYPLAQERVGPEQPPGWLLDPHPLQGGAVQHPQRARAMLHPDGTVRNHGVEGGAVESAARAAPAHRPQPCARRKPAVSSSEGGGNVGRALEPHRSIGGRHGEDVDVVVVERGQQGATAAVDHVVTRCGAQRRTDLGDRVTGAHVDPLALDLDVLEQQHG